MTGAALPVLLALLQSGAAARPLRPAAIAAAVEGAEQDARPPRVGRVEVRVPPGEDAAALQRLVRVEVGTPLSPHLVRAAVRSLFGVGRFGNVVARTEPGAVPGEVTLVLECLPRRSVAALELIQDGAPPALDEARARRAAGLAPGDELWPGREDDAARRVEAAYARRGYRGAKVEARVAGDRAAIVSFSVRQGAPTVIAAVRLVSGGRELEPGLGGSVATRPGAALDLDVLEEDARALRTRLRGQGYLRVRVDAPAVRVEGERADVEIPIDLGPRVDLRFRGNHAFTEAELLPQLGLDGDEALDARAVEVAAGRVQAFYVANGFAGARVGAREIPGALTTRLVLTVEEGPFYRVADVSFPGVKARDPRSLRERLDEALEAVDLGGDAGPRGDAERLARAAGLPATARARAAVEARHVWNPPVWDAAAQRLVELYRADGYLDAAYDGTRATLDARRGTVEVELRLREGVRTLVSEVVVEGQVEVPAAELDGARRLAPGDPLSYDLVEATRAALLDVCARHGHVYAKVEDVEEISLDHGRARVRFRVDEGPQVRVRSVVLTGARRTRRDVVLDALAIRPGDVYDPEAATRSQAALLRLGVFRSVGLRLSEPEVADGAKDLTVEVAERPWRTLAPGVGFSLANGPRAFVELVQPNLFGRALELTARAKVNYPIAAFRSDASDLERKSTFDRIEGRGEVGLHDPRVRLFGLSTVARVDAIAERLHRPAYDLSRGSTVFGVDLPLASRVALSMQYELEIDRIVKTDLAQTLTQADVERLRFPDGVTTLQSLRPVLVLDFRDNPLHPRRGWLASATADYVRSIGSKGQWLLFGLVRGSEAFTHMLKLSGTISGYLPIASRTVFAVSIRGGRVLPLDPSSQTIGPKRFFLGGAATMRGHGEDELIPEDVRSTYLEQLRACTASTSAPGCSDVGRGLLSGVGVVSQGGEAFALAKAELRFGLSRDVEAGVFADAGNLWLDPRNANLADLRLDVGVGLRCVTPIGPAVLDVGFDTMPDRRLGESWVAPHFSIGLF